MTRPTWIVVADGARGRIFSRAHGKKELDSALPFELVQSRSPMHDRVTDRGGQTHESAGPGGHTKSKSVDAKEHDQQVLAKRIADAIRHGRTENRFEKIVLIAPPAFLGQLRGALDEPSRKLVSASHAKDLSGLNPPQLQERLLELD